MHSSAPPVSPQCLDAALAYAGRGWRVTPLAGKVPRLPQWPEQATTAAATISQWWRRWPTANVGLVTGVASGLAVVDVDPRHGGDGSLEELQRLYHPLPDTPQVMSGGGGWHYYFALEADLPCVDLAPGVNFLADGHHQVVAPPSLHPSSRRYVWELSSHPDDTPLAPLPAWIRALVYETGRKRGAAAVTLPTALPVVDVETLKVSAAIKTLIRTGHHPHQCYASRSEAVFAVLTALIRGGHDDATMAAVLLDPHHPISDKPLSQKNPRSPLYGEQTRTWVAREIARARAKVADALRPMQRAPGPALWRPLRPCSMSRLRRTV